MGRDEVDENEKKRSERTEREKEQREREREREMCTTGLVPQKREHREVNQSNSSGNKYYINI
jgi:hypothetical protein